MKRNDDHLKLESKIILFILSVIVFFWGWFFILKPIKEKFDIEVGDVYIYEPHDNDPFNNTNKRFYKIIEKKENYVKFIDIETSDTMTMRIRTFLYGTHRFEEKKDN